MGVGGGKLEKLLSDDPHNEHYFGLENYGNTCYCNSVLQALYFCRTFRQYVIEYGLTPRKNQEETLLDCLADVFLSIATHKKKTGVIEPRKFIGRLRKESEIFHSYMQQDAHEFLNYLLNTLADILKKMQDRKEKDKDSTSTKNAATNGDHASSQQLPSSPTSASIADGTAAKEKQSTPTLIQQIFEGTLINETKCLCCENVTSKEETFLDLSVDVQGNSSVGHSVLRFCSTETLHKRDKFHCDSCASLQEAQKRITVKRHPKVLVIHLKRFKFVESLGRYEKLSHRVAFSQELKLPSSDGGSVEYKLSSVVIHIGYGLNQGHYVAAVQSHNKWFLFDDETVELMPERGLHSYFGTVQEVSHSTSCGYLLFYELATDNTPPKHDTS